MKASWTRRATLALAASAVALLAACGDGSVISDLKPTRFITVGDSFADVGQGVGKFTVNDGSLTWVQGLASHFDQTVTAASTGGWGYAQGYARVDSTDTSSGTNAPSVKSQLDLLLARYRRMLGLFVAFYASLHLLAYGWLDMGFDVVDIGRDILKRPFILVGFTVWLLLLPLTFTSTNAAVRALGGRAWQALHRLVYVISPLALLHFFWMRAGKNDFAEVMVYAAIIGVLLLERLFRYLKPRGVASR